MRMDLAHRRPPDSCCCCGVGVVLGQLQTQIHIQRYTDTDDVRVCD